jgi:hypothetical protein
MKVMQQKIAHEDDIQSKVKDEIKPELDKFKKVMENIQVISIAGPAKHTRPPLSAQVHN